jgi:small subunit ribosomal protein S4
VNGKRVTIPSYRVRAGEVVSLKPSSREFYVTRRNLDTLDRMIPLWLEAQENGAQVRVAALPQRDQIDEQVRESLIVELYSK